MAALQFRMEHLTFSEAPVTTLIMACSLGRRVSYEAPGEAGAHPPYIGVCGVARRQSGCVGVSLMVQTYATCFPLCVLLCVFVCVCVCVCVLLVVVCRECVCVCVC